MIHTPWKFEFQSAEQGFGVIDATGRLVAAYADAQSADAICIAMNRAFPKGSPQCSAPGILRPGYAPPYQPDPRKPRIA